MKYNSPVYKRIKEEVTEVYTGYHEIHGNYEKKELDSLKFCKAVVLECITVAVDECQYESSWELADKVKARLIKHFDVEG
jgi:hypothetical protein